MVGAPARALARGPPGHSGELRDLGVVARLLLGGVAGFVVVTDMRDEPLLFHFLDGHRAVVEDGDHHVARKTAIGRSLVDRRIVPGLKDAQRGFAMGRREVGLGEHVGHVLVLVALHELGRGLDLVEQTLEEQRACGAPRAEERADRLHPDLVRGRRNDVVAKAARVEGLGMRDHEFARRLETLQRIAQLLRLRHGEIARADADEHAFHARVALRGIERHHDVHHRKRALAEIENAAGGLVLDRLSRVELQHHVEGRPSPETSPMPARMMIRITANATSLAISFRTLFTIPHSHDRTIM